MITVMSREEQRDAVIGRLREVLAVDGTCDRQVLGYLQQILYAIEAEARQLDTASVLIQLLIQQAYGVLDAHDIARNERREVSS